MIMQLLVTPAILLLGAKTIKGVEVDGWKAVLSTSVWIIVVGFLIGWLITLFFNVITFGIFWIIGLGVITRTIAYAIIIEIIDWFKKDFITNGFLPSLWLSILLAIGWGVIDIIF